MVTAKLVRARRAALTMGTHMKGPALQYLTTINAIVESAAIWILPTFVYLTSSTLCDINIRDFHKHVLYSCAVSSSFSWVFGMTSVSRQLSVSE
jgi:hypothetical protein